MNDDFGYNETMLRAPADPFDGQAEEKEAQENLDDIKPCTVFLVEDDWDDYFFAKDSFEQSDLVKEVILITYKVPLSVCQKCRQHC